MDRWKKRVLQLDPSVAQGQVLEVEGVWQPDPAEPSLSLPVVLRPGKEGSDAPSTASLLKELITSLGPKFEVQTVDTALGSDGPLWTLGQWERYWRLRASSSAAADSALTLGAPGGSSVDDEADSSSVVRLAVKGVPAAASLPPGARSLSLEVPCLSLDSSPLEERWPIPPAAAALDLCAQVWGTEDGGGPAATPGLHLSPPGLCSLPILPPSAAGVWIRALAGVQSVILVPPGGRSWAVAAGKAPDHAEEINLFCALAAEGQAFRVDLRPQDVLLVPPGWLHASAAAEGAISFRGTFLLAEAIATHLDARRLQDGTHHVSPTRQFPLFKQTMWRAAVVWGEKLCRLAGLDDNECQARVSATRDAWKKEAGRSKDPSSHITGSQRKANKIGTSRGETPDRRHRALILEDSDEDDGDVVQRVEEEGRHQRLIESKKGIDGASFNNTISSARPSAAADRSFPSKEQTARAPHRRLMKKKEERAVGRHSKTTLKRHVTAGSSRPRLSKETNGSRRTSTGAPKTKKNADAKRKRVVEQDGDDFLVSDEGGDFGFEDGASDADWGPAASSEEGLESERGSGAHDNGDGGLPLRRLSARQRAILSSQEPWRMVGYPKEEGEEAQSEEEEALHQRPAAGTGTGRSSARARRLPARLADTEVAFPGFQEYEEAFDDDEEDDQQSGGFTNEEQLEEGGSSFSSVQGGGVAIQQQRQRYRSGSKVDSQQPAVGLEGVPYSKPATLRLKIPVGDARPATPVVRIKFSNRTPTVNIPQIDGAVGDDPVDGSPNGWKKNEALSGMYRELFGDDENGDDRHISNGDPPGSTHTKASTTRTRLDHPQQNPSITTINGDVPYKHLMQPALASLLSALRSWLESPSLLNDVPLTMDDPWDVAARLEIGMKSLQWDVTPPPTRFVAEKSLEADNDDAVLLQAARLLESPAVIPQTEVPCLSSETGGSGMDEQEGEAESMSDYVPDDLDEHVQQKDAVIDESDDRALGTAKDRAPNPVTNKAAAGQGGGGPTVRPAAAASGRGAPAAKTGAKKPGMSVKARLLKKLRI